MHPDEGLAGHQWLSHAAIVVLAVGVLSACTGKFGQLAQATSGSDRAPAGLGGSDDEAPRPTEDEPGAGGGATDNPGVMRLPFAPSPSVLGRLTRSQYENVVRDLLGEGVPKVELEADTAPYLFTSIGAASTSVSERATQLYELAALSLARSAFVDAKKRAAFVGCTPAAAAGDVCTRTFIERFGARAFRRPLETEELDRLAILAKTAGGTNAMRGLEFATAAILMSPSFLYRVELGEASPDHADMLRYTGYEIAERMSFLLWNSMPDAELARAASAGELTTREGLEAQARRLLTDDARVRRSFRQFFSQYLGLSALAELIRDPKVFPSFTPTLGGSMQQEIEQLVEHVVFDVDTDIRELFITTESYVNAELATLYGLPAVTGSALTQVSLPSDGPRGGILTTAGLLSLVSHPDRTSPTRRGQFVRQRLLCGTVPEPPEDIPALEETKAAPDATLREKLTEHRTNPACSGCHTAMDPIGLGFEDFDAIGAHRATEQGRPVDATGDLDGTAFVGGRELGELLRSDERFTACLVKQLYRHAVGRLDTPTETISLDAVAAAFAANTYRVKELLVQIVLSDAFRFLAKEAP